MCGRRQPIPLHEPVITQPAVTQVGSPTATTGTPVLSGGGPEVIHSLQSQLAAVLSRSHWERLERLHGAPESGSPSAPTLTPSEQAAALAGVEALRAECSKAHAALTDFRAHTSEALQQLEHRLQLSEAAAEAALARAGAAEARAGAAEAAAAEQLAALRAEQLQEAAAAAVANALLTQEAQAARAAAQATAQRLAAREGSVARMSQLWQDAEARAQGLEARVRGLQAELALHRSQAAGGRSPRGSSSTARRQPPRAQPPSPLPSLELVQGEEGEVEGLQEEEGQEEQEEEEEGKGLTLSPQLAAALLRPLLQGRLASPPAKAARAGEEDLYLSPEAENAWVGV